MTLNQTKTTLFLIILFNFNFLLAKKVEVITTTETNKWMKSKVKELIYNDMEEVNTKNVSISGQSISVVLQPKSINTILVNL